MRIISNVKVGKAKIRPTAPTHIAGTRQGNKPGSMERTHGLHAKNGKVTASAGRSTGVNSLFRNSIVPGAPRLTPM